MKFMKENFKNGIKDGYGIIYYENKKIFEGEFKNGIEDGYGITYYENGNIFEGEFKNGNPNGIGIDIDDFVKYEGECYSENNCDSHGYEIEYYNNVCKYEG